MKRIFKFDAWQTDSVGNIFLIMSLKNKGKLDETVKAINKNNILSKPVQIKYKDAPQVSSQGYMLSIHEFLTDNIIRALKSSETTDESGAKQYSLDELTLSGECRLNIPKDVFSVYTWKQEDEIKNSEQRYAQTSESSKSFNMIANEQFGDQYIRCFGVELDENDNFRLRIEDRKSFKTLVAVLEYLYKGRNDRPLVSFGYNSFSSDDFDTWTLFQSICRDQSPFRIYAKTFIETYGKEFSMPNNIVIPTTYNMFVDGEVINLKHDNQKMFNIFIERKYEKKNSLKKNDVVVNKDGSVVGIISACDATNVVIRDYVRTKDRSFYRGQTIVKEPDFVNEIRLATPEELDTFSCIIIENGYVLNNKDMSIRNLIYKNLERGEKYYVPEITPESMANAELVPKEYTFSGQKWEQDAIDNLKKPYFKNIEECRKFCKEANDSVASMMKKWKK